MRMAHHQAILPRKIPAHAGERTYVRMFFMEEDHYEGPQVSIMKGDDREMRCVHAMEP